MPVSVVTVRGESSSRKEPRRLRLAALTGDMIRVRIHNPENTSGLEFDLLRSSIERIAASGPAEAVELRVAGTTATAHLAAYVDGNAYVWAFTSGDDGWDILVMQTQLERKLADLVRR